MFLKRLSLTNYRNYPSLDYKFKKPITVLVGENAQGKSNLLEAIYFLATTKSLKADEDTELITYGDDHNRVAGEIEINNETTQLEILMQKQSESLAKRVKVNGLPRRVLDYIGNLYVVAFAPEDIYLVTGPPSLRRWHVDITLAQVDRDYKRALTNYSEVVTRKNKVLKRIREGEGRLDELDFWADQQIILGEIVTSKRQEFFDYLNAAEKSLPVQTEKIEYEYLKNVATKERLEEYRPREIGAAASLVGPHRDDFKILQSNSMNQKRDLHLFGSRGEQRTAILDLKVSEVSYIEHVTGKRPLLLLDDVFSELDAKHRQHVIKLLPLQQTIMASVEMDSAMSEVIGEVSLLFVRNGRLSETADTSPEPQTP